MKANAEDIALEFLRGTLEDEFGSRPGVRVKLWQRSGRIRSIDLVQDYDPEQHTLHLQRGVVVRVRSRDYFFPVEWAAGDGRRHFDAQVREIREFLENSGD